ncbi:unnamed protein product [Ectocarpus sp. 4 AP-2014]
MPLTAEYTWAESETIIQVQVPLKGQSASKLDVFATECYLKVSFPPYLLEVDLDGYIDSMQPKARVENGTLMIKAKKKEGSATLWGSLGQRVSRKCDPKVKARREESIKEKLKLEDELKERVSLRKHQDERLALRSQMSVEEDERRRIDDIKAEEKEKAEAEVYRAFAQLAEKQNRGDSAETEAQPKEARSQGPHQQDKPTLPPSSTCSPRDRLHTIVEGVSDEHSPTPEMMAPAYTAATKVDAGSSIWQEETATIKNGDRGSQQAGGESERSGSTRATAESSSSVAFAQQGEQEEQQGDKSDAQQSNEDETPVSYTPPPRTSVGVIPVGFTTRLFPTPLRESKVADESAWIMKNRRHLHKNHALVGRQPAAGLGSAGIGGGDKDISESDPVWLKSKGDDLYRGGDFLGAVNAYTAALDADPRAAACLSNRAACYLRLSGSSSSSHDQGRRHASACVADCGGALEILRALPETGPSQARALARRSLAYRELGHYQSSLEDCRAALLFSPGDTALLEEAARGEPLAQAERCKKEGATRFAAGDVRGACELYTTALEAVPGFPPALSNRAACYLALGKPGECVRDCTAVLEMLSASDTDPLSLLCGDHDHNHQHPIPRAGSSPTESAAPVENGNEQERAAPFPATAAADRTASSPPPPPPPPPPVGSLPPPGSEKRTKWVMTTVARRARANLQLDDVEGALRDFRMANSICPGNKGVEEDIRELERRINEAETPLEH